MVLFGFLSKNFVFEETAFFNALSSERPTQAASEHRDYIDIKWIC